MSRLESELVRLRQEVASQRRQQDHLLTRIERLEAARAVPHEALPAAVRPMPLPFDDGPPPDLPTIRLEPPRPVPVRAPPLDTRIELRDPSHEQLRLLDRRPDEMQAATAARETTTPEFAFAQAVTQYNSGDRAQAAAAFDTFVSSHPRHVAAGKALYLAGLSRLATSDCATAIERFETLTREYPDSDARGAADVAWARCDVESGRVSAARERLQRVLKEHPRTAEASQAEALLDELGAASVAHRPPFGESPAEGR